MNTIATVSPPQSNPFARASSHDVNQGTIDIESSRAIAEAQGKLVIAKKFPRDKARAYEQVIATCQRLGFAEDATYSLPRGAEPVTGPSIRLAEEIARAWGNTDFGIRELARKPRVGNEEGYSEMQVYCWDLETNVMSTQNFTVRHWRDTKQGGRALRDETEIYEVTASQSGRRLRARILAIVPPDLVQAAVDECVTTIRNGGGEPLQDRVRKMIRAFAKLSVTGPMLETYLGHSMDAILPEEFVTLQKIHASVKDGMSTAGQWFAETVDPGSQRRTRPADPIQIPAPVANDPAPDPDPAPPAPADPADPHEGLRARLQVDGISEAQFLLSATTSEWFFGDRPSIESLTDTDIAWCRAKYKRVILPACKPVPLPSV